MNSSKPISINKCSKNNVEMNVTRMYQYRNIIIKRKELDKLLNLYINSCSIDDLKYGHVAIVVALKNLSHRYQDGNDVFKEMDVEMLIAILQSNYDERSHRMDCKKHDSLVDLIVETLSLENYIEKTFYFPEF